MANMKREDATILAALRLYQHYLTGEIRSILNDQDHAYLLDGIASNLGNLTPLDVEDINDLCDQINFANVQGGAVGRYTRSRELNPGDWVLYNGKARQVYKYYDNSFATSNGNTDLDFIDVLGLKKTIRVNDVTILREVTK